MLIFSNTGTVEQYVNFGILPQFVDHSATYCPLNADNIGFDTSNVYSFIPLPAYNTNYCPLNPSSIGFSTSNIYSDIALPANNTSYCQLNFNSIGFNTIGVSDWVTAGGTYSISTSSQSYVPGNFKTTGIQSGASSIYRVTGLDVNVTWSDPAAAATQVFELGYAANYGDTAPASVTVIYTNTAEDFTLTGLSINVPNNQYLVYRLKTDHTDPIGTLLGSITYTKV